NLLLDHVLHSRLQVLDGAGEAGEVFVVLFGNLYAMPLAELHHDVEEVHAVQLKLLAEGLLGDEARQVLIGGNIGQNIEDFLANIGSGHWRSRENFLMITTELIPNIPNELFRMYSTRLSRRGSPTTSVVKAHSG